MEGESQSQRDEAREGPGLEGPANAGTEKAVETATEHGPRGLA